MKKRSLHNLLNWMKSVNKVKNVTARDNVLRNIKKVQPEVEILDEHSKPSDEFVKFEQARNVLMQGHCIKNKDGSPATTDIGNGRLQYHFEGEGLKAYNEEAQVLALEHKEAIEEYAQQMKEYEEILDQDIELNLIKVKMSDFPLEVSGEQLEGIMAMIEEEK